ncbi:SWIM zinc finger family protein [uncultured Phascolarctobacterium sp.]|uniref:SWIM zinc finger family protein n=1 Tax=uncultured Phascolarctobacterium sp. TaxID=512296 RepID=UPI0025E5EBC3|nr:SWIM zinc finger family protein [uncultured Phascolarctobacterium sp.]
MTFGNWDASIHSKTDQIKRINTSKQIKSKNVVDLDAQCQTARISGSSGELYEVTLDHCTCFDFDAKRGPCKHIYKLADEMGLLPPQPTLNAEKAETFKQSIPAEIERFKQEYLAGAISADKFIKIANALNSK